MNARKEKAAIESFRRRKTCLVCGKRLQQPPHGGRPRMLCTSELCERTRRQQLRGRDRTWHEEDFAEAVRVFGEKCAFCRKGSALRPSRFHLPPVPACADCHRDANKQLTAPVDSLRRLAYYLANVARGAPLPRPYGADE